MIDISQIKKIDAVKYNTGVKANSVYNKLVVYKNGDPENAKTIGEWILELKKDNQKRKHIVPSEIFKCASGYFNKVYRAKWNFAYMEDIEEYNVFNSITAMRLFLQIKHNNKELVAYNKLGYPAVAIESVWHALKWLKGRNVKGADYRRIIECARDYNKKVKTHKGFIWRFLEDIKLER